MNWVKEKHGRLTYYTREGNRQFSDLIVEELDSGDQKIYFSGMTGTAAASEVLGLDDVATMDPEKEIPRIFQVWETYVRKAGICKRLADLNFLEVRAFGVNPVVEPTGCAVERARIPEAYAKAYARYWREHMSDKGLPVRFTVFVDGLPDAKASFELSAIALYQKATQKR